MAAYQRKYNVATAAANHIVIPMIKAGVTDFAVAADWTPAAGDVKVTKNGGTPANIATLPSYTADLGWVFPFSAAELSAEKLDVLIVDSATKAVEDQFFSIETFGNALAMRAFDLDTAAITSAALVDLIWDELLSGHLVSDSFGEVMNNNIPLIRRNTAVGGAASSITLDTGASTVDDTYTGSLIFIISGTGVGQSKQIGPYNGTSKVASVTSPWVTNPASGSVFVIVSATVFDVNLEFWRGIQPNNLLSGKMDSDVKAIDGNVGAAGTLKASMDSVIKGTVDDTGFSPSTTQFESDDITETNEDQFNSRLLTFTSGILIGQFKRITDYVITGGRGHFTVEALTDIPGNNDTFIIH